MGYNFDKAIDIVSNTYMVLILPATDYIWNLINTKEKIMDGVKTYKGSHKIIYMSIVMDVLFPWTLGITAS